MPAPDLTKIHLRGCIFLECAVLNDETNPVLQPSASNYTIAHKVAPSFNVEDKLVVVDLLTTCTGLNEQGEELAIGGRFRVHLTFEVDNLHELLDEHSETGQLVPSEQLVLTLISVGYSTSRGMIMSKTVDTVLQGFALPLLDVRTLSQPAQ